MFALDVRAETEAEVSSKIWCLLAIPSVISACAGSDVGSGPQAEQSAANRARPVPQFYCEGDVEVYVSETGQSYRTDCAAQYNQQCQTGPYGGYCAACLPGYRCPTGLCWTPPMACEPEAPPAPPPPPPPPICDPASQPSPDWGAKNGQCLPSCGALGGTASFGDPCEDHGMLNAGTAYDVLYCCAGTAPSPPRCSFSIWPSSGGLDTTFNYSLSAENATSCTIHFEGADYDEPDCALSGSLSGSAVGAGPHTVYVTVVGQVGSGSCAAAFFVGEQ
jgi:hypothetical protein